MKNKQMAIEEMLMVNNIMNLEEYVYELWTELILFAHFDDYLNFRLEKIKNQIIHTRMYLSLMSMLMDLKINCHTLQCRLNQQVI